MELNQSQVTQNDLMLYDIGDSFLSGAEAFASLIRCKQTVTTLYRRSNRLFSINFQKETSLPFSNCPSPINASKSRTEMVKLQRSDDRRPGRSMRAGRNLEFDGHGLASSPNRACDFRSREMQRLEIILCCKRQKTGKTYESSRDWDFSVFLRECEEQCHSFLQDSTFTIR